MDHIIGATKMTPKLVIFDCDGVLVDSEPATNQVIASDLVKRGLSLSDTYIAENFVGGTMKDVERKAKTMGAALPHDWLDVIYGKMFDALRLGVKLFPDVELFLDALAAQNIAIAIVSNGPMEKMVITLTPSGLNHRFDDRIYSGHDYPAKPAPDMINHAMQVAGVTAKEAIFIDDSANGSMAGIAAGVRTFGFDPSKKYTLLGDLAVEKVWSMRQIAGIIGVDMPE
jgi:HAD superfamily hydrolase (TIGR01509 family)